MCSIEYGEITNSSGPYSISETKSSNISGVSINGITYGSLTNRPTITTIATDTSGGTITSSISGVAKQDDIDDLQDQIVSLKEEVKDLRETIKLIGDSLVEYANEHDRKKRKSKKK